MFMFMSLTGFIFLVERNLKLDLRCRQGDYNNNNNNSDNSKNEAVVKRLA